MDRKLSTAHLTQQDYEAMLPLLPRLLVYTLYAEQLRASPIVPICVQRKFLRLLRKFRKLFSQERSISVISSDKTLSVNSPENTSAKKLFENSDKENSANKYDDSRSSLMSRSQRFYIIDQMKELTQLKLRLMEKQANVCNEE